MNKLHELYNSIKKIPRRTIIKDISNPINSEKQKIEIKPTK